MARDGRVPPMGDPLDALAKAAQGGIDLSKIQAPPPRTTYITDFRSTLVGFEELTDDNGVVEEYRMVLLDQNNAHTYRFVFDEDIRSKLQDALNELAPIGTVRTEGE